MHGTDFGKGSTGGNNMKIANKPKRVHKLDTQFGQAIYWKDSRKKQREVVTLKWPLEIKQTNRR